MYDEYTLGQKQTTFMKRVLDIVFRKRPKPFKNGFHVKQSLKTTKDIDTN